MAKFLTSSNQIPSAEFHTILIYNSFSLAEESGGNDVPCNPFRNTRR